MDIDPRQLIHQLIDGVHVISFRRDEQGRVSVEFARQFFATQMLQTTADMNVLVVDLTGVATLDSSSLGPLVQKLRDVQEHRGRMALSSVQSPAMREIFSLTRFDKVFRIYATRAEAIKALTTGTGATAR